MARQRIQFDPATKEFEAYLDFSGGYNSEVSNERLNDNEYPVLMNVDNAGRGSAKTRSGRVGLSAPGDSPINAKVGQGIFNFYRSDTSTPDLIIAADGYLYAKHLSTGNFTLIQIGIVDGANTNFRFQQTLPVEAAQYQNTLFIATGTKLVEVTNTNGTYSAKVVVPYQPTAMEAIYIGTNGLADNPDGYIQDGVSSSSFIEVVGIKPQTRNGSANTPITMTAYINRPSGYSGIVEYKWEYKKSSDPATAAWTVHKDWTDNEKVTTMTFSSPTKYDIKVTARKDGETTGEFKHYTLASFTVNATADKPNMPVTGIHKCRKIILHWDRILLAGDDVNPYQMYISDLQNPRYFPVSNTISFDFGKQEPITAIVRFQDMLVIFTRTTIQTLAGKSTDDYKRYLIHDGIGCVAGRSAAVVGNNVIFLSQDGIYGLRPNIYRLETMNVVRIDQNIQHEIDVTSTDACGMVHDSQYWLCFPKKKLIYRYYYERRTWAKDYSENLNISQFLISGAEVYNLTSNARLYRQDINVFTDAGAVYDMTIETKFYDLSASFNNKKLKRLYLLAKHFQTYDTDMYVTVKADSAIVLTPETGRIVEDNVNGWYWESRIVPNFEFLRGTTFGTWIMGETPFGDLELSVQRASIRGKCRRVRITVTVPSTTPAELYGFGLEFKLKKI